MSVKRWAVGVPLGVVALVGGTARAQSTSAVPPIESPSPWVAELNGGIPNVDFTQQKVVADASGGYSTGPLGLVGRGWIDTYNLASTQTHDDYTHVGGSVEGWWLSGDSAAVWRLELRAAGEFDYYDTTTYPLVNPLGNFYDFDSRIGRGNVLVGVHYRQPDDRLTLHAQLGGGMQYEDPDTTTFTNGKGATLQSNTDVSADATARLFARARVVPGVFGTRLRAESTYFTITREQLLFASSGGGVSSTSVERDQQIEVHARLFFDADVAAYFGFVPALFVGLDYLGIQGSATSSSNLIPSVGIGIVREDP